MGISVLQPGKLPPNGHLNTQFLLHLSRQAIGQGFPCFALSSRELPEAPQHILFPAPGYEQAPICSFDYGRGYIIVRRTATTTTDGQQLDLAVLACLTIVSQRTCGAQRRSGNAYCGAQFHQGLVELTCPSTWDKLSSEFLYLPLSCCLRYVLLDSEQPAQHPAHIAVDSRDILTKCDGAYGTCGISTDSRKRQQCLESTGQTPGVGHHHALGCSVQVSGTGIVAESLPELQDIRQRCLRKRLQVGKPRQEPVIVRNHGIHLCLL
jgi:hypothetical protein